MKSTIITIILLVFVSGCSGCSGWSNGAITREVAWQVIHVADWGQTRDIAMRLDEGYYERGPARAFIGREPSVSDVDTYMGISAIAHPIVTHMLPTEYYMFGRKINPRAMWQYVSIGVSGSCVVNNANIGLNINF